MRSVYSLVCFSMLVSMCIATTPMTIVNSDPDYQTGQFLAIKLPAEYAGTTISYYNTGYGSNMATASLNATLGIMSNSFSLQGGILGWNITVSSLTATGITIGATAVNSNNKITYLRVCWMVSNHSLLNLNYFSYTLDPLTMTVANTALPSTAQCQPMSCRTTILSGLSYKNINKNNVVLVFLGGFSTSSDNGSNALGILLKSTNIGTTSCQLNITVYDQINLDTISVYYIAFGSGYIVTPNFVYQGTQTVGCVYSTATCTPFPASNNSFSIGTSFTFYSVQQYFIGVSNYIVQYDGTPANDGSFAVNSITLSGTSIQNAFSFLGSPGNHFTITYSYFFLYTGSCPTTGSIYLVYNSNQCNNTCNNGVGQYPDINNICQLCDIKCFNCSASSTLCTGCNSTQNRVLVGSDCLCDSIGTYDDGVSIICNVCHYSCYKCYGNTNADCSACDPNNIRTLIVNTCPCNPGYYDNGGSVCVACSYTCLTCSTAGNNKCLTCNGTLLRGVLTSGQCNCLTGYYDSNIPLCQPCVYYCQTCMTNPTNCTSCLASNFRTYDPILHTCDCMDGNYDNGVPLCVKCDSTCLTCTGSLPTNCLTCDGSIFRGIVINSCICIATYFDLLGTCTHCDYTCYNCTAAAPTDCLNCNSATTFRVFAAINNTCNCPDGYTDVGVSVCATCHITCLTCSIAVTNCTSCNPAQFRVQSGTTCPCITGYVDTSLANGSCTRCHYSCYSCTGAASSQCSQCPTSSLRTLSAVVGSCLCPSSYYDDGNNALCLPCNTYCLQCNNKYTTSCTACNTLYFRTLSSNPGMCICLTGYYDNSMLICNACDITCLTCSIVMTNCTTCNAGNFRIITTVNTCVCIGGYYQAGAAACLACSVPCLNCTGLPNTCTACSTGRFINGTTCSCNAGTYENVALVCQPCSYSCATCVNSSTTCLNCPILTNRALSGTACNCNPGYFDNGIAVCVLCSYSCLTCTSLTVCTSCPIGSQRTLQANGSCICPGTTYDNGATAACQACSATCLTCSSYSICTSCSSSLNRILSTNNCYCTTGYYDDLINAACQKCDTSCASCYGSTTTSCYTCTTNRVFTSPNSCPCAAGYYQLANTCVSCSLPCVTCSIISTNCTSCDSTSYLIGNQCYCNNGYFRNGNTCTICDTLCGTCLITAINCLSCNPMQYTILSGNTCICPDGRYQNLITLICLMCEPVCLTCIDAYTCSSCSALLKRVYNSATHQCLCDTGYYDAGLPLCSSCNTVCYTCNGPSALNCTSCATGYLLIGSSCKQPVLTCPAYSFQGYCVNSCPSTSFAVGMICTLCINNCLTCQSATICLTCLQNYYYNATAKTCVVLCPQGTYADSTATCQLCPSVCSTCRLIVSTVSCLLCAVNHYILNGTCIANCPSSTHIIQLTHCIPCLQGCLTCVNLTAIGCLSCSTNYSFSNGSCLHSCPTGYYSSDQQCIPCQTNCQDCSSTGCKQCQTNYYLSLDKPICIANGHFLVLSTATPCHPNCLSCTNSSFSSCIKCDSFRGDHSQMAISGYCDCWTGSIDVGEGKCDMQAYIAVEKTNKVLVSATSSVSYLAIITGAVTANGFAPILTIMYQQTYANFYYLNSSAVLQTDDVLSQYQLTSFNRYLASKHKIQNNVFGRMLIDTRLLVQDNIQATESLFMRGQQWLYVSDWAFYTFIAILIIWCSVFITKCIIACLAKQKQNKVVNQNPGQHSLQKPTEPTKHHNKCLTYTIRFKNIIFQGALILLHLLTINQFTLYAAASFKILLLASKPIVIYKLLLSIFITLYYIVYMIRLLVGVVLTSSINPNSSLQVLFVAMKPNKKRSAISRLYIPLLMLRNMGIALILVFLSSTPELQIGMSFGVCVLFTIYSMIWCPYSLLTRLIVHLFQLVFLGQLFVLGFTVFNPQSQRINPTLVLLALNFVQMGTLALLSIQLLVSVYLGKQCDKDVIDVSPQDQQKQLFEGVKNITEQTLQQDKVQHNKPYLKEDCKTKQPTNQGILVDSNTIHNLHPQNISVIFAKDIQEPINPPQEQLKRKRYRTKKRKANTVPIL